MWWNAMKERWIFQVIGSLYAGERHVMRERQSKLTADQIGALLIVFQLFLCFPAFCWRRRESRVPPRRNSTGRVHPRWQIQHRPSHRSGNRSGNRLGAMLLVNVRFIGSWWCSHFATDSCRLVVIWRLCIRSCSTTSSPTASATRGKCAGCWRKWRASACRCRVHPPATWPPIQPT